MSVSLFGSYHEEDNLIPPLIILHSQLQKALKFFTLRDIGAIITIALSLKMKNYR